MGKRKRDAAEEGRSRTTAKNDGPVADEDPQRPGDHGRTGGPPSSSIQIVAGSYERVLHGVTATLPPHQTSEVVDGDASGVSFADTFLFHAHSSAIRCVAVSPSPAADQTERVQKVILATGGTDERINLYHLSARRPLAQPTMPTLAPAADTMENPKNRELGTLLHHASSITALKFVSRSKLLSSAEDNTIAVTRTRDWTVLSAIKAPLPRVSGRPTGDTAPPGTMPAGVNDFAVHPSRKLMLSVSKGERCMRLWNLMTGKKAGVLNFGREILQAIGERKAAGAGEARKVDWDAAGEEFVVGFERAAVVFNLDCTPKCQIIPSPPSKVHQIRYVRLPKGSPEPRGGVEEKDLHILAISTEDGRVIFYSTTTKDPSSIDASEPRPSLPPRRELGQLGGKAVGITGRMKDFTILDVEPSGDDAHHRLIVVTGSSDGAIRIWMVTAAELHETPRPKAESPTKHDPRPLKDGPAVAPGKSPLKQIGRLLGTYATGIRITCLTAFALIGNEEDDEAEAGRAPDGDGEEGNTDSDDT